MRQQQPVLEGERCVAAGALPLADVTRGDPWQRTEQAVRWSTRMQVPLYLLEVNICRVCSVFAHRATQASGVREVVLSHVERDLCARMNLHLHTMLPVLSLTGFRCVSQRVQAAAASLFSISC